MTAAFLEFSKSCGNDLLDADAPIRLSRPSEARRPLVLVCAPLARSAGGGLRAPRGLAGYSRRRPRLLLAPRSQASRRGPRLTSSMDFSPPGWIATSRASFEMSTPTLCAAVDLIFSQSSSCLGGMTPGCPFRPLGKERGGQTTGQSFQIGALTTHPLPPPSCVAVRPAAPDPAGSDGKTIRQGALSADSVL